MDGALLCRWALEHFENISSLRATLNSGAINFVAPAHDHDFDDGHFALRDATGEGLVVEFQDGTMHVYVDNNDNGLTGYGVMTNEPNYPWQLESMKTLLWKEQHYGPMVSVPGSWYPDARYQRLVLVKSKMSTPKTLQEAVANAGRSRLQQVSKKEPASLQPLNGWHFFF